MEKIKSKLNNSGFVLLFAVTLAAILLAIALGVSEIAFRELQFSTSAKDTNEAFFAADTGAELALFNDRSDGDQYPLGTSSAVISGLGSNNKGCAYVTITKTAGDDTPTPPILPMAKIISKGYNNGSNGPVCAPSTNSVERELDVTYYSYTSATASSK